MAPYPSRYAAVLARVTPDSRVLDIGIGTAGALVRNQELVLGRRVTVVGIDPEREYVTKLSGALRPLQRGELVTALLSSEVKPPK